MSDPQPLTDEEANHYWMVRSPNCDCTACRATRLAALERVAEAARELQESMQSHRALEVKRLVGHQVLVEESDKRLHRLALAEGNLAIALTNLNIQEPPHAQH